MVGDGSETSAQLAARRRWMSVLARASAGELDAIAADIGGLPAHEVLKPAETGTIMVEARAGGTGRRFNLGEATMTRCVVRLTSDGECLGYAYALGTERRKARTSAILDAILQAGAGDARVVREHVERLALAQSARREQVLRKAAATKVDFFTLVRGQD